MGRNLTPYSIMGEPFDFTAPPVEHGQLVIGGPVTVARHGREHRATVKGIYPGEDSLMVRFDDGGEFALLPLGAVTAIPPPMIPEEDRRAD